MSVDKFLTDLAAHVGACTVRVEWSVLNSGHSYFNAALFERDATREHGLALANGDGATVDEAIRDATAKLRTIREDRRIGREAA